MHRRTAATKQASLINKAARMGNLLGVSTCHPSTTRVGHSQIMSPMMSQQPSQHSGRRCQYNGAIDEEKGITKTEEATEYR